MSQTIRIPANLYQRLSLHAKGFETPANVIEKILNFYEAEQGVESTSNVEPVINAPVSLEIIYYPSDEHSFKQALLQTKRAYIMLHKVDGTTELKEWNATRFDVNSDVNGNLRSGYLRGWKNKGIFKAEISTNQHDVT
jgi:hypothetical protein